MTEKEYLINNYCSKVCKELFQNECKSGVRTRCSDFEEREKLLEDFTEQLKANADYQIEGRDLEIKELCDENEQLKAQIEKMKCGQNCKHSYLYQEDRKCKFTYCDCINCKDKWQLKE